MNSRNDTSPFNSMDFTFRVMRLVLYPLVLVFGIIGNLLVTLVIFRNRSRHLRPSVRYFIFNLAISDLIVLVMFIPFDLAYLEQKVWLFGLVMCKFVNTLNYAFVTVSGTTIAAISIERQRSIVYPVKKPLGARLSKMIVVAIWFYAILTLVPFIDSLYVTPNGLCINDPNWWPSDMAFQVTFILSCLVPGCVLPLACITLCYVSIAASLIRQHKKRRCSNSIHVQTALSNRTRRNRKTMKVLSSLVAVYSLCVIPHYIILSLIILDRYNTLTLPYIHQSHEFTRLLITTNSCLNPIMYSAVSKEFRDKLRYILCKNRVFAETLGVNVNVYFMVKLNAAIPKPLVARENQS